MSFQILSSFLAIFVFMIGILKDLGTYKRRCINELFLLWQLQMLCILECSVRRLIYQIQSLSKALESKVVTLVDCTVS